MKLYLGCAMPPFHNQHYKLFPDLDSFTWVDLFIDHPKVKRWDATKLDEVSDNSTEVIYASHLLEHFPHINTRKILKMWYDKLQNGGKVIINVPDLLWSMRQISRYENDGLLDGYFTTMDGERGLLTILYGSQSHSGEYHMTGFTKKYLEELLRSTGFTNVTITQEFDAHDMGVLLAEGTK